MYFFCIICPSGLDERVFLGWSVTFSEGRDVFPASYSDASLGCCVELSLLKHFPPLTSLKTVGQTEPQQSWRAALVTK